MGGTVSGVIYKGNCNQALLPNYEFAPNVPMTTTHRETGTRDRLIGKASSLRNAGFRVSVTQDGTSPLWILEAKVEGDPSNPEETTGENTHELRANILYPDIKTNLVLQRQFGSDAAPDIAEVQMLAGKIQSGEYTYTTALASISLDISTANQAVAIQLLDLLLLGTDSFPKHQYVYVHTFNFGTLASLTLDTTHVGKMFTTQKMQDYEGIPSSLSTQLPEGYWLKMAPEKVVSIGQGESLKYEYWWAEAYSTLLYDLAP